MAARPALAAASEQQEQQQQPVCLDGRMGAARSGAVAVAVAGGPTRALRTGSTGSTGRDAAPVLMPTIGFGTAGMRGEATKRAVSVALEVGFRHFDGAEADEWYDDAALGEALRAAVDAGRVAREDLFVTSKVHPKNLGTQRTRSAVAAMLQRLRVDYLDLVLLHFPSCGPWIPACRDIAVQGTWQASWRVLEDLHEEGIVRAIGVSNFDAAELQRAISWARVLPHVVQNWFDPFHSDTAVRDLCNAHGIGYTSYSTLGGQWEHREPHKRNLVMHSDVLQRLAERVGKSLPVVVLSWALQRGAMILPRSTNPEHIRANAELLAAPSLLGEADLDLIDGLALE